MSERAATFRPGGRARALELEKGSAAPQRFRARRNPSLWSANAIITVSCGLDDRRGAPHVYGTEARGARARCSEDKFVNIRRARE